jgi:hypothetical protein
MAKKTVENKPAMISGLFIAMSDETFTKGKIVEMCRSCGIYETKEDLASVVIGKPIDKNGRNVVKIQFPKETIIHKKGKTFGIKKQMVKILSVEPLKKVLQMMLEEVA